LIPHSKAFSRLKEQAGATFNFAIVVCHAVPSLKIALKNTGADESLPFSPDYFDSRPIPTAKVREHIKDYKEVLSRQIFLSSFSFFEAYFLDLLKEIVEFHGGTKLLDKLSITRNTSLTDADTLKEKRKLQEYPVSKNKEAYASYGSKLAKKGFAFPSTLLARYGIEQLLKTLDTDYIKAANIPELIESVLQLPLDPSEKERFSSYRDMRNKIAHGRPDATSFHLRKSVEANDFLRNLALKIDRHVIDNFLVVEL
jgi:RiboL-PSP-HEPN